MSTADKKRNWEITGQGIAQIISCAPKCLHKEKKEVFIVFKDTLFFSEHVIGNIISEYRLTQVNGLIILSMLGEKSIWIINGGF